MTHVLGPLRHSPSGPKAPAPESGVQSRRTRIAGINTGNLASQGSIFIPVLSPDLGPTLTFGQSVIVTVNNPALGLSIFGQVVNETPGIVNLMFSNLGVALLVQPPGGWDVTVEVLLT